MSQTLEEAYQRAQRVLNRPNATFKYLSVPYVTGMDTDYITHPPIIKVEPMKENEETGYHDYFLLDNPALPDDEWYMQGWQRAKEDREYHLGRFDEGDDEEEDDDLDW